MKPKRTLKTKHKPKAKGSKGPAVNCAHDDMVPVGKLKPNPDNPNRHGRQQVDLYAKILLHQGWRKAIVVSNQSGRIVTGHGAWETAKACGWPTVPVDYQDFDSPADEMAHLLADNQLPQMAEMDEAALAKIIEEELPKGFDLDLAGLQISSEDIPDLPEPPRSVKENLKHLNEIKSLRKKGAEAVIGKNDTEFYLVIAFGSRQEKSRVLKRLGLPEDERYLDPANIIILPGKHKASKRPKSSPRNRSGACG